MCHSSYQESSISTGVSPVRLALSIPLGIAATGLILGWLWLRTESIWLVAIAHGASNSWGQYAFRYMQDSGTPDREMMAPQYRIPDPAFRRSDPAFAGHRLPSRQRRHCILQQHCSLITQSYRPVTPGWSPIRKRAAPTHCGVQCRSGEDADLGRRTE